MLEVGNLNGNKQKQQEGFLYTSIGLAVYVISTVMNRFLFRIPNPIYFILILIAIFFIIKGFRERSKSRSK